MIITAFFNFLGIIIAIFFAPFIYASEAFTAIPYISDAVAWLFRSLLYFRGLVPVNDLYAALSVLIVTFSWVYFFQFLFWFISKIRGGGKGHKHVNEY